MFQHLPQELKVTATQAAVKRCMAFHKINTIAQLQQKSAVIFNNDIICQQEAKTRYWYKKLRGVAFRHHQKIERFTDIFPQCQRVLDHELFQLLALDKRQRSEHSNLRSSEIYELFNELNMRLTERGKWLGANTDKNDSEIIWHIIQRLAQHLHREPLDTLSSAMAARYSLTAYDAVKLNNVFILMAWSAFLRSLGKPRYLNYLNQRLNLFFVQSTPHFPLRFVDCSW
jgi:hypothetical protein